MQTKLGSLKNTTRGLAEKVSLLTLVSYGNIFFFFHPSDKPEVVSRKLCDMYL